MSEDVRSASDSYFLSYSRTDEGFALRLARDVRAQGVAMWVDQLDIRPSEHWDRAIERAVGDCRGMVVILSPRSVASDNVADEISFAIDSGKSVLPIMIERCTLPLRITRMQVIDAIGNYERALQQCLTELKRPRGPVTAAIETAPQARAALEPETLLLAKSRLAAVVGPIAGILVEKAASRASSLNELYCLLAQHIEKETDRESFLATLADGSSSSRAGRASATNAGESTGFTIAPAELDSVAAALTHFLGPIAPIVAKRESRASSSFEELTRRLAAIIPSDQDRAEFLRRVSDR